MANPDSGIEWAYRPVAVNLHPSAYDYGVAYQAALERSMSGARASPVFSRFVNQSTVHWTLLAETGRGLDLPGTAAQEWFDVALLGSFLAFNQVVDDTFERAPALDVVRTVIDSVLAPSIEVVVRKDGEVRVRHPTGLGVRQRLEREEFADALEIQPRAKRRIRVHFGVGWQVRPLDAPESEALIGFGTVLAVQNLAIDSLRTEFSLIDQHWSIVARQGVVGDFGLTAALRSEEDGPEPARWSTGVVYSPQPRVSVRLERTSPLNGDSFTLMLTLRAEQGSRLPGRTNEGVALLPTTPNREANRLGTAWAWAGDLER